MNIINKLTLKQMRYNKRRTLVTIIGIILAVAMITAIFTVFNSVEGYLRENHKEYYEEEQYILEEYGIYGLAMSGNMIFIINAGKLVLTVVVMIAALAFIANGFMISMSERTRYLGILSSVGTTVNQKRSSVYFEGVIVGLIGIPIGIILGISCVGGIIKLVEPIVQGITEKTAELNLVMDAETILWTIIFSVLTIMISAYIPAKRASGISPVAAIRQEKDIKISQNDVKTGRLIKNIFGFEGELALKNIKRNKNRYRAIVFSIFISIVLFISAYSVITLMWADVKHNNRERGYDLAINYSVWGDDIKYTEISYNENFKYITDKLMNDNVVQKSIRYFNTEWCLTGFVKDVDKKMYSDEYSKYFNAVNPTEPQYDIGIIFMSEEELKDYLDTVDIDYDKFIENENNVIFYDGCTIRDDVSKNINIFNGNVFNDELKFFTIDMLCDTGDVITEKFNVFSIEEKIMGMWDRPYILVTPKMAESFLEYSWFHYGSAAYFETDNADKFEEIFNEELNKADIEDAEDEIYRDIYWPQLENREKEREKDESIMFLVEICVYGFIGFISLLCIANIINSLSTGMALKKRELAMLMAMGMTKGKMQKMVICEGLFYGLKAVVFGVPVGALIDGIIRNVLQPGFGVKAEFDMLAYVIVALVVFAIILANVVYAVGKVNKQNTIDLLKNENV